MAKTQKEQRTPTGHVIPVPKRGDFFSDLKKVATPEKSKNRGSAKKR